MTTPGAGDRPARTSDASPAISHEAVVRWSGRRVGMEGEPDQGAVTEVVDLTCFKFCPVEATLARGTDIHVVIAASGPPRNG